MSSQGLEVLGAAIGSPKFIDDFTSEKFSKISLIVNKLSNIAKLYPQHTMANFLKSTKHKATYLARTIRRAELFASPYNDSLESFLVTILGQQLDEQLIAQSAIPIARGGLGININFKDYGTQQFNDSLTLTHSLTRHITSDEPIDNAVNTDVRKQIKTNKKSFWDQK